MHVQRRQRESLIIDRGALLYSIPRQPIFTGRFHSELQKPTPQNNQAQGRFSDNVNKQLQRGCGVRFQALPGAVGLSTKIDCRLSTGRQMVEFRRRRAKSDLWWQLMSLPLFSPSHKNPEIL